MDSSLCIGIDVSQDWLDLAAHPTRTTPALQDHSRRSAFPRRALSRCSAPPDRLRGLRRLRTPSLPRTHPRPNSPSPSSTPGTSATMPAPPASWLRPTALMRPSSPSSPTTSASSRSLRRHALSRPCAILPPAAINWWGTTRGCDTKPGCSPAHARDSGEARGEALLLGRCVQTCGGRCTCPCSRHSSTTP